MSGSGREALPDVWEESRYPPECLAGLPGCPRVLGGTPKCLEVVWRPSRMSGSGRECISNVWEWLGDPPSCP